MGDIRFGTDGWRAVMCDEFTFGNVRKVAHATAMYFKGSREETSALRNRSELLVGYDNRFHSEHFAEETARVFAAHGFKVLLSEQAIPTPVLSHAVVRHRAMGGVMITASHNPYMFNGFKVKMHYGASAPREETKKIELLLSDESIQYSNASKARIVTSSFVPAYQKRLHRLVDIQKIKRMNISMVIDPIYGSASGVLENILKGSRMKIFSLRSNRDPLFGGVNPEPIKSNLEILIRHVLKNKCNIGIAFDGDGDRIGLVDEKGNFVNAHQIFSLLLWHCAEHKKMHGKVVKTISSTYMVNRLASAFGSEVIETPIGFKYITEQMLCGDVMIGGEESGGIGFSGHIPERDAVLSALYILEMMALTGKGIGELTKALARKAGPSSYDRVDVHLPGFLEKKYFITCVKRQYKRMFSEKPREIKDYDGIKFIWDDDSWLLLRISGTEPVLRIYAESGSKAKTQKLLALGKQFQYNQ